MVAHSAGAGAWCRCQWRSSDRRAVHSSQAKTKVVHFKKDGTNPTDCGTLANWVVALTDTTKRHAGNVARGHSRRLARLRSAGRLATGRQAMRPSPGARMHKARTDVLAAIRERAGGGGSPSSDDSERLLAEMRRPVRATRAHTTVVCSVGRSMGPSVRRPSAASLPL